MCKEHALRSAANLACVVALALSPKLLLADANEYRQINLVSDISGMAAVTDPNLKNPWGVSHSTTSPFWVSNQATGTSTLYNGAGAITPLVVNIPGGGPPSGPTGQVNNGVSTNFVLPNGTSAAFIFDTLNGTIAGWNGAAGTTAVTTVTTPGAVYTGLAIGSVGSNTYLYAADTGSSPQIRVYNSTYSSVTLAGNFTDPNAVAGFVPFNVQANTTGSQLYVTYAQLGPRGAPLPGGYVDVFNTDGTFVRRAATGNGLYAPWGVTLAPGAFGQFSNDLLVGNFGNGEILAFDPGNGNFLGVLDGTNGQPIVNDFLWALDVRTAGTGVNTNAVYFTAGINNQADGLFGDLIAVPEPAALGLAVLGISGMLGYAWRRRKVHA
jgi:uncharacterized protein (TIGR03118 family)